MTYYIYIVATIGLLAVTALLAELLLLLEAIL